jgi:serine/threonine-protein kinase RsbW
MTAPITQASSESWFPSSLEATERLLDWFERYRPPGLDPLLWIQAQTALVEGFTNAVRHAHGPLVPPPPVMVSVEITATRLRLQIIDQGAPFDITCAWTNNSSFQDVAGQSNTLGAPSDGDGLPALPDQDSHWGLIMLGRLRRDFGWVIGYDPHPNGGNKLVMERPLT